jgi:hypothetical protein
MPFVSRLWVLSRPGARDMAPGRNPFHLAPCSRAVRTVEETSRGLCGKTREVRFVSYRVAASLGGGMAWAASRVTTPPRPGLQHVALVVRRRQVTGITRGHVRLLLVEAEPVGNRGLPRGGCRPCPLVNTPRAVARPTYDTSPYRAGAPAAYPFGHWGQVRR